MVAPDLHRVLSAVYEAGQRDVSGSNIEWPAGDEAAVNRALNMRYLVRRDVNGERLFSLTDAGYRALGIAAPQGFSIVAFLRRMLRHKAP